MQYVLIDHENVQPADLAGLDAEHTTVLVFTGAEQKVGIALIEAVQALGQHGRFIRITGNGKNALDFHIACYLGKLSTQHPQASFVIVSKDTGFDPLIAHLGAAGIVIKRIGVEASAKKAVKKTAKQAAKKATKKTPAVQPARQQATVSKGAKKAVAAAAIVQKAKPQSDADKIVARLKDVPAKNLPSKQSSLRSMAATWLASKDSARMDHVIAELAKRGVIDLAESKIRYTLPK